MPPPPAVSLHEGLREWGRALFGNCDACGFLTQEKKVKKFKKEKKRTFNAFQKLQSRRNFWSVTHPAKATSLSYRR